MENKENPLQTPTEELHDPQKAVAYLNAVKLAALTNPWEHAAADREYARLRAPRTHYRRPDWFKY